MYKYKKMLNICKIICLILNCMIKLNIIKVSKKNEKLLNDNVLQ